LGWSLATTRKKSDCPCREPNQCDLIRAQMAKVEQERLSEKGRRSLRCSLTEHRNGTFRPILVSLRLPNPR
jgi:hypothetical protein